ncbi:SdpI family protein [Cryobacterium sp. M91]|uniref:SdpI family protein n=1 Tax=Cryobacterium sp. M91 TaxID=2048294 RepID=UPI0011B0C27A|nr:SdpI family protein [Cryobacterium sp. M91]
MFYPPIAGFLVLAGVMVSLAVVQQQGRLKRNSAIGIRTRHTLASGEAWASAHAAASPYMVAMAVVAVAFGFALLTIQLAGLPEGAGHVVVVTGYVVIVAVALVVWRVADCAAKAITEQT